MSYLTRTMMDLEQAKAEDRVVSITQTSTKIYASVWNRSVDVHVIEAWKITP